MLFFGNIIEEVGHGVSDGCRCCGIDLGGVIVVVVATDVEVDSWGDGKDGGCSCCGGVGDGGTGGGADGGSGGGGSAILISRLESI